jgi:hypothetical protein
MDRSARFKPAAEGNVLSGETEAPAIDARARLIVTTAAGVPVVVAGSVTPADNFANPTDAVTTWSLCGGLDPANTWDRLRVRPWPTTAAAQTASAAALDVIGMMVGPDGAGNLVSAFVDASGNQRVAGTITPADNFTTPTNAIAVGAFLQAYDGTNWDMPRATAPVSTITSRAPATIALQVNAQLWGANGSGSETNAQVTSVGALSTQIYPGLITLGDNVNFGSTPLCPIEALPLLYVESTLPTALTTAQQSRQRADQYGAGYSQRGAPPPNTRDNPTWSLGTTNLTTTNYKASAGTIYALRGMSKQAINVYRYLQVHNKASAPAGGDVPIMSFAMPGETVATAGGPISQFAADFLGAHGYYLGTGVSLAWSSTRTTYTAPGGEVNEVEIAYF